MSLLSAVVQRLEEGHVAFAAIGASAMAHYGVSRATLDVDLLCVDVQVLEESCWQRLRDREVEIAIRRGDADDPLAGVVRFRQIDDRPVDLIVGSRAWQQAAIDRSLPGRIGAVELPVVTAVDLILLKLYAGGPQDAWDIAELLGGEDREELCRRVETELHVLPDSARSLWRRVRPMSS